MVCKRSYIKAAPSLNAILTMVKGYSYPVDITIESRRQAKLNFNDLPIDIWANILATISTIFSKYGLIMTLADTRSEVTINVSKEDLSYG